MDLLVTGLDLDSGLEVHAGDRQTWEWHAKGHNGDHTLICLQCHTSGDAPGAPQVVALVPKGRSGGRRRSLPTCTWSPALPLGICFTRKASCRYQTPDRRMAPICWPIRHLTSVCQRTGKHSSNTGCSRSRWTPESAVWKRCSPPTTRHSSSLGRRGNLPCRQNPLLPLGERETELLRLFASPWPASPAEHAAMLATKRRLSAPRLNHCSTTTSRRRPDLAGRHRTQTRSTPDRIRTCQGLLVQMVAGVGFEPT
jgi:hypothetical protein